MSCAVAKRLDGPNRVLRVGLGHAPALLDPYGSGVSLFAPAVILSDRLSEMASRSENIQ